jgi:hypothetical protein
VELTRKGLDLANRAMADHAAAERRLCAMLSGPEQDSLALLLSRMIVPDRGSAELNGGEAG